MRAAQFEDAVSCSNFPEMENFTATELEDEALVR